MLISSSMVRYSARDWTDSLSLNPKSAELWESSTLFTPAGSSVLLPYRLPVVFFHHVPVPIMHLPRPLFDRLHRRLFEQDRLYIFSRQFRRLPGTPEEFVSLRVPHYVIQTITKIESLDKNVPIQSELLIFRKRFNLRSPDQLVIVRLIHHEPDGATAGANIPDDQVDDRGHDHPRCVPVVPIPSNDDFSAFVENLPVIKPAIAAERESGESNTDSKILLRRTVLRPPLMLRHAAQFFKLVPKFLVFRNRVSDH